MDNILEFLLEIQNEYKSKYLSIEQNIERVQEHISDTENKMTKIKDSIDESYAVMSSSQAANEVENTELQSLTILLDEYKANLAKLKEDMKLCSQKVEKADNIIKEYNDSHNGTRTDTKIKDKLELVLKLMKPDPDRAKHELTTLIKNMSK